ncbi:hypothetical protein [Viscerimonas tarda]
MKKILFILTALFVLTTGMAGCDKEEETSPQNISLYGKDSLTIQKYIQGKWNLVYAKGGIAANYIHYFNDCTVEFTADKKYITSGNGTTHTLMYYWQKYAIYTGSTDSICIMQPIGTLFEMLFEEIRNDTLIYSDAFISEPMTYFLVKSQN